MQKRRYNDGTTLNNNNYLDTDTLRYYNSTYVNTSSVFTRAQNSETRSSPILDNPSDWLMSVVRFDIDTRSIPINLVSLSSLVPISPNAYSSTSFITLTYHGVSHTQNVIYLYLDTTSQFLYPSIYNYQTWLDFVNTSAALAFASIGIPGSPPIFIYDPITGLINLFVDQNYLPSAGANQVTISINIPLYKYLTNFSYSFSEPNGLYTFIISNSDTVIMPAVGSRQNLPIAVQNIVNLYLVRQLAIGTGSWTSLRSIILTSNMLPFRPEAIPQAPSIENNYSSDNLFPIISDFLVPVDNPTSQRIVVEYLPTAQYRYVDLISNVPLYSVNFFVYWSDFFGNIYPVFLNPGESMSIKILFQKRNTLLSLK